MRTNHRILGMESHIAYGVCFILPFIAIIALLVDRRLDRENHQFMWEAVLGWLAAFVLGAATFFIGYALAWVVHAIMIFIGVLNLTGQVTHLPLLHIPAEKIAR